jgi:hypothetical protein
MNHQLFNNSFNVLARRQAKPGHFMWVNWRHILRHACLRCGREFEENLSADLGRWLVAHLDLPLLPVFQVIWGKPNEWQLPGDQGSEPHLTTTSNTKTP